MHDNCYKNLFIAREGGIAVGQMLVNNIKFSDDKTVVASSQRLPESSTESDGQLE